MNTVSIGIPKMSITLTGYQLLPLPVHEGVKTVIYRGIREAEQKSVIVKALKAEYPTLEEIIRLRHEYKILQLLDLKGIVKPLALENYKNGLALILEDFGGESLQQFVSNKKIDLTEFFPIAIQVASALAEIHYYQIIHKDIKPQNILINVATGVVKITDFGISSRLSRENQTQGNPTFLEGTLAYMSPEQTGRMNRSIDYRTDFYSLGVTFYEMLTGTLPFSSSDPLELLHCHIAKQPVSPSFLNPEIPQTVSSIVMKLLAKNAEDRYQSAQGLKVDLEECLTQLQATGNISDFIPGMRDKSGQFLIPQKLYGREAEVAILMDAFERVSCGTTEMMLVSGYSGIGKTSVVNEIHKPIVGSRGYFIAGKFDQFKRNIPYAGLIQAFHELIRQLLTESDEQIAVCQKKLLDAFGPNGQVIIDVIPEIELIVGQQPSVPLMGPTESQNRFNRVFKEFIHVFTRQEHPLAIFLDDLQWADSASLKLIRMLITDPDSQYLLMIGAYRDNEVSPTHPLMMTLDEIQQAGAIVNNITLQPLALSTVNQLVADTLQETERAKVLAELLFNKTQGNPFFLTQLLQTIYNDKLLKFDFVEGRWLWDIEQIQAIGITDYNVVELVAINIQKLPKSTQEVLKLAACIGNQFNLDVLAIVNDKSLLDTADALWNALHSGLILPLSNTYKVPLVFDSNQQDSLFVFEELKIEYKFLHDRVQQAAYSLITEGKKKAFHLKIGQLLLQKTPNLALVENIFDIVNQMNIGVEFINNQTQKNELASLNLIAARKAKAATAYEAAVKYLNVGRGLLNESSWLDQYDLTLALYVEAVEAEYLSTNYEQADQLSSIVLSHAKTLLEKVRVYELKIQFTIAQNQLQEALDTALEVLTMLGVSLEQEPPSELIIEDLINLPEMTDPDKLAAMRILVTVIPAAYMANPQLLPLVVFTLVNLCIKYGNSSLSAFAYCFYGVLLCGALGNIDSGYRFGQLALRLLEQFDAKELKSKLYKLFNVFIRPWKEHIKETIESFLEGIQSGLEIGDIEYACYNAAHYCNNLFFRGEHLELVIQKQNDYIEFIKGFKQQGFSYFAKLWKQMALNLIEQQNEEKYHLVGEAFNENEIFPILIKAKILPMICMTYLAKCMLSYLFKNNTKAIENAKLAAAYAASVVGMIHLVEHNLYYSLALLAQYPNATTIEQEQILRQVATNQEKMQHWAYHAPCNFEHKYNLVEAEKARVLGQHWRAMEYYDASISGAKEQGYIQEEALASELAAEFYFSHGKEKIAQTYLTDAYYGYIRWGAQAKVKDLESRYPQVFSRILTRETSGIQGTRTTTSTTGTEAAAMDLATVMKASLAISGEIVLDQLLEKLMHIMVENAGARKGSLLLKRANQLVLVASKIVEKESCLVLSSIPIDNCEDLPLSMINYIERTKKTVVLNSATTEGLFTKDPYIVKNQPKSILGLPIIYQGKLTGILYLENDLTTGAFTSEHLEVLKILASQVSISIENAHLYTNLQTYSQELEVKNAALSEKTQQLETALHQLQQTQTQLVQAEKISSLGQLVAGVAHEVNNPVGFISGNLYHASGYVQDLIDFLNLYQQHFPNPPAEIQTCAEAIQLDYLLEDLPKLLNSMHLGTERIREIMQSLRNFSRVDEAKKTKADIHKGLDSTLMILQHRLRAKAERPAIELVKEYAELPKVECYAGQLNQVFMNILANAIDAIDEYNQHRDYKEIELHPNRITISTSAINGDWVAIRITDNGPGMTHSVRQHLFEPFFTTKPVGKGTGLGLSISYQIVVEKHGGQLRCVSAPGQGTEFIIEIPLQTAPDGESIPLERRLDQHHSPENTLKVGELIGHQSP